MPDGRRVRRQRQRDGQQRRGAFAYNAKDQTTSVTAPSGAASGTYLRDRPPRQRHGADHDRGRAGRHYQYDPYGALIGGTGTAYNPYCYTGAYIDAATGLVKIGQRYYDPSVGRWTQQDPLVQPFDPAQANRYSYAGCNLVNNVDPMGRAFTLCSTGFFGAGVAASIGLYFAPLSGGASRAAGIAVDTALLIGGSLVCD